MGSDRDNGGRFRPGQSGNPNGRPRARRSVDAAVTRAMAEKLTVTEQGRRRRKSKLEITATQLANQSASGDLRAAKLALDQARKAEERAESEAIRAPSMTQSDHDIAARVIARLRKLIFEGEDHDASHS
jgi:hypothetical protein